MTDQKVACLKVYY